MTEALARQQVTPTSIEVAPKPITAMALLQSAVERGADIGTIERLAKLQREIAADEARIAFAQAFANFKRDVPVIFKTASIPGSGETIRGKYAPLDQICEKLIPSLIKVGITHRWKSNTEQDGRITVTCYLRHEMGFEEEGSSMMASPDTSGNKQAIQASGSTVSYLERYTLVASCGIAIKGQDNDGAAQPEWLTEALEKIALSEYPEELQKVYLEAYKRAHKDKDKGSMGTILFAKDKRLNELKAVAR